MSFLRLDAICLFLADRNGGDTETAGTEHINNDQNGFEFATKFL
jgi:hypothetical protein